MKREIDNSNYDRELLEVLIEQLREQERSMATGGAK